jgi:hypothetical protein
MAIDFSSIGGTPAQSGKIDFSAIGGIPAVGQDESTDDTSALGAAGRGAVGMLPLGTQAYSALAGATENKSYPQERKEVEKEIESDIANHPMSRLAGQAAGIAAPALLTGGASAPASLGEATTQGALMGAGFGAGNAIDTLASGGSGAQAAGNVALGTALGAGGGAIGQKLAGALEGTIPSIETYAAKKAAQGVGMGSDELGNMSKQELLDTGKMLMDKGIVKPGASTQEMFDTARTMQDQYGQQIGQIASQSRDLGLSTDIKPLLDSLDEKYKAASVLQNPDEMRNALFYKKGMADILTMARQNLPDTLADVQGAPVPNDITFDQLQRLKKSYGNSAFMNGTVKNPAAADVYSALSAGQKAIVNTAQDNPNLPAALKDAMSGYSQLHPVVDGLQDVLGRERAGNMPAKGFGMIGKLVGSLPGQSSPPINALTSLGLLGAGHPLWALGAATATLQNPRAMSSLAQGTANAIPGVAEKLPMMASQLTGGAVQQNMGETNLVHPNSPTTDQSSIAPTTDIKTLLSHPAFEKYRPTFQQNAAQAKNTGEAETAMARTDFIKSQTDPAYAAAKQKAIETPNASDNGQVGMAKGGVAQAITSDAPVPGFGSTLTGFAQQLKNPTHEASPTPQALPTSTTQKFNQPFNSDMADKLKAFLESKQEDESDDESR